MASPLVSRSDALKKRTHHQHLRGIGYVAHTAQPELPGSANGKKNCAPPSGTKDATHHMMKPPNGAAPIRMSWVAAEKAWASMTGKGNRMAWTTDHLMRAGWEYAGPV